MVHRLTRPKWKKVGTRRFRDVTQHFVTSRSAEDYEAALSSIHGVAILCFDSQPEDGQCRRLMIGKFESPSCTRPLGL